jgi:hypothetical protein
MTDPLPQFVYAIHFEGAPITCRATQEECRAYLLDVSEEDAESYQVWAVDSVGEASIDRTIQFADAWADEFDMGSGDDRETILAPYPAFIRAFIGDQLIAAYRAAQEQS